MWILTPRLVWCMNKVWWFIKNTLSAFISPPPFFQEFADRSNQLHQPCQIFYYNKVGQFMYIYLFTVKKMARKTTKYFRGQRLKKLVWNSTVIHEKTIDLVVLESVVWSKFVPTPTQPRLIRTLCISLKQHQHLFKIMIRSA